MKFDARIAMDSHPEFAIEARTGPVTFQTQATGALRARTGPIGLRVSRVPIRLAIPFSRKRGGVQIASLGGFHVKLAPFTVAVRAATVQLEGVLGTEGLAAEMKARVGCHSKLNVNGKLYGRIAPAAVDLPDDDDLEEDVSAI